MLPNRVRVGVIGAGRMGERHCRVYAGIGGVEFVGVSDRSLVRGSDVAAKYEVPYYADHLDLLDRVDAVSVATPTDSHFEVAAECLRRGVHVLVEKPLAGDLAEARALEQMSRHSRALLQVGHIERFNPAFLELQSIVDELEIVAVSARRLSPFDSSNTEIDVVFDLMIHDVDLVLALLGQGIQCVQASHRSARTDAADYAVASLAVPGGPIATLTASRVTEQKVRLLEITALGAYVEIDLLNKSISVYRRTLPEYIANHCRPLRYRQESVVERIHIPTAEPLMLELQDFIRSIRDGRRPTVSAEDGVRAVELATEIRASMDASGRRLPPALVAAS